MDKADQAQIEIERSEQRMVDNLKKPEVKATADCEDCGFEIPIERRKAIKTNLCVGCAEIKEIRDKGYRRV